MSKDIYLSAPMQKRVTGKDCTEVNTGVTIKYGPDSAEEEVIWYVGKSQSARKGKKQSSAPLLTLTVDEPYRVYANLVKLWECCVHNKALYNRTGVPCTLSDNPVVFRFGTLPAVKASPTSYTVELLGHPQEPVIRALCEGRPNRIARFVKTYKTGEYGPFGFKVGVW